MDRAPLLRSAARLVPTLLFVAFIGLAVASISGPQQDQESITRLSQIHPALLAVDLIAGLSMILAGCVAWIARRRAIGLAAVLAGCCWFAPDWAGAIAAAGPVRAAGLLATVITLPLLAVVAGVGSVGGVTGSPARDRRARIALAIVAGGLAVTAGAWLVAWQPALDPRCLAVCDANPLGLGIDFRLARGLANLWQLLTLGTGVALTAWAVRRTGLGRGTGRRRERPVLVPAAAVGLAWSSWALTMLLPSSLVEPSGSVAVAAYVARAVSMTALAVGLAVGILDDERALLAVRGIARRLSPFPGSRSLEAGLAAALGDSQLRLAYALPGGDRFVDGDGLLVSVPLEAQSTDRTTPIRVGEDLVALAIHASSLDDAEITAGLGASVRLAADNERLLASVRHEVLELRGSRARIVEAGDAIRRRLERDLHDGAQQRMLGILHDLAVVRDDVERTGTSGAAPFARAVQDVDETIEALRRLARGLHPSILAEAGLSAAVDALADEASVPIEIDDTVVARCAATTETAAWWLAALACREAERGGATVLRLTLAEASGRVQLDLRIDGLGAPFDTAGLADRAGAAGGDLTATWSEDRVMTISADLPCE